VGWICQLVPFHRSATVLPTAELPTAVHADDDVQATPFKTTPPAGLGVGWICHLLPFHRSARVVCTPDLPVVPPTAMHADGVVHATPKSPLNTARAGLGVGWTSQRAPFHRSVSVTPTPEVLV
jgi:hypothetical protein